MSLPLDDKRSSACVRPPNGFTLVQLSVILTVVALVLVVSLPGQQSTLNANAATASHMQDLLSAVRQFQAVNGYLPCPADASIATGNANYGVQATGWGNQNWNCDFTIVGGYIDANLSDTTNNIAIGMVPVTTLGLPPSAALDSWGREITYAVDTNANVCFPPSGNLTGHIAVMDNGIYNNAVAVLVSHGADGHGAWLPVAGTGGSGTGTQFNAGYTTTGTTAGTTDPDQLTNAHKNINFTNMTTLTNFVKKPATTTFDDIVVYKSQLWNLNRLPLAAVQGHLSATSVPANGVYYLGQTLSIALTNYSQPGGWLSGNTPTGYTGGVWPGIQFFIGSNSPYSSFNGTYPYTYGYTILPTDQASSGIYMTPYVYNMHAVSSSSDANSCPIFFTAPNLSGVKVSAPPFNTIDINGMLWVADSNNNQIQSCTTAGSCAIYGSSGSGTGQLTNPSGVATDSSANVYVADTGNNRIVEFTVASGYLQTSATSFGSAGTGAGQFSSPMGIFLDSSTSCSGGPCLWVVDTGNSRVQKCSTAGVCTVAISSGLNHPTGITMDSTANCTGGHCVYLTDTGSSAVRQFNTSGTLITSFGRMSLPTGIGVDASANCTGGTSCLWIIESGKSQLDSCSVSMVGKGGILGTPPSQCTLYSGSGSANGYLTTPAGLVLDSSNNIWVVDSGNSRVEEFNSSGAYVSQFGTSGSTSAGQFNF